MKKTTEEWWKNEGLPQLNKVLIEIVGQSIGFIPLENLTAELPCNFSQQNFDELIPLMVKDGCTIKITTKSNGKKIISIYVK